jgi:hypothetical protein
MVFDNIKATIAKEVVLTYPDFSKVFEIYTDTSTMQLGAVITQDNRPIAFFSRKLSVTQAKYSVTKIELLAIVETLKEVKRYAVGTANQSLHRRKKSNQRWFRLDL